MLDHLKILWDNLIFWFQSKHKFILLPLKPISPYDIFFAGRNKLDWICNKKFNSKKFYDHKSNPTIKREWLTLDEESSVWDINEDNLKNKKHHQIKTKASIYYKGGFITKMYLLAQMYIGFEGHMVGNNILIDFPDKKIYYVDTYYLKDMGFTIRYDDKFEGILREVIEKPVRDLRKSIKKFFK